MAHYRKISCYIGNDQNFREFSTDGKVLWFSLLTHQHLTSLGGMRATLPGLAAEMGWTEERLREAFREPSEKGMVLIDEVACCLVLPKFLKHNGPESPNVVKSWAAALDLIPECNLKLQLINIVKDFAYALPKAFSEALPEAFRKSMPNQEQEQEQEQEQYKTLLFGNPEKAEPNIPEQLAIQLRDGILKNNPSATITESQLKAWTKTADVMLRLDRRTPEQISYLIRWSQADEFWHTNILSMDKLRKRFDQLAVKVKAAQGNGARKKSAAEMADDAIAKRNASR